jgi:asparagine synthase (glutamine-hydrolysing)
MQDQLRLQVEFSSLPVLLHWQDRNSMAHSLESRLPFLDYRLAEFCQSLPAEYKLYLGETKRVLRSGLRDILPREISKRVSKLGFATGEQIWITKQQPERFRHAVQRAIEQSRGAINSRALDITDEVIAGRRPFCFFIWRVLSFGSWMQQFQVRA